MTEWFIEIITISKPQHNRNHAFASWSGEVTGYSISASMPIRSRNEITSDLISSLIILASAFFSSSVPISDLKFGIDQDIISAFFVQRVDILFKYRSEFRCGLITKSDYVVENLPIFVPFKDRLW